MSKKLQGNGLFESSRMMLPEHKEAFLQSQHNLRQQPRPYLDEQEAECISLLLAESLRHQKEMTLVVFGEYGNKRLTGVVTQADPRQGLVKLQQDCAAVWISAADIVGVRQL
ncbi:YolD-like family protein [Paenibacillus sp. y28]|uniref:YolD-like family protein n=1 Tax=Paenibacillus sp. y28 TaxID=3129110 RepID=UPI003017ECB1